MPGQDGTGPEGYGPRSGRGFGPCGAGLGRGYGRGFGRRFGCRFQPIQFSESDEKKILQEELQMLDSQKEGIAKRLKELK